MSYDEESDYYDDDCEEEEMPQITEYIKEGFPDFTDRPVPAKWIARGTFDGDIKWNNSDLSIEFLIPTRTTTAAIWQLETKYTVQIKPFTGNCGAKSIQYLCGDPKYMPIFLTYLESFLVHRMNCGIVLGSDCIEDGYHGNTGLMINKYGMGYVCTDPVWNPNYTWGNRIHKIFLFYKYLKPEDYVNYWG